VPAEPDVAPVDFGQRNPALGVVIEKGKREAARKHASPMRYGQLFADRTSAGRALAQELTKRQLANPVVLALPRGGIPVAVEIARALKAPLDLVLVRKIGVPFQPELAAAAVVDGSDPDLVLNEEVVSTAGLDREEIERAAQSALAEIERRRRVYLKDYPRVPLADRTLILVDDGIATGASMRAAIKALKRRGPRALIVAVPVAPQDTVEALSREVDEVICLATPEPFLAIGFHYRDFTQLSDADVVALLAGHLGNALREPGAADGGASKA
jgi:putative phosphoribosyl transferase